MPQPSEAQLFRRDALKLLTPGYGVGKAIYCLVTGHPMSKIERLSLGKDVGLLALGGTLYGIGQIDTLDFVADWKLRNGAKLGEMFEAESEQEVWNNTAKAATVAHDTFCNAFPGCVSPPASIKLYDLKEFGDQLQQHNPSYIRYDDNFLRLFVAVTLDNGDVLFNKDAAGFRDGLFPPRDFDYAMMLIAGDLMHEEFHRDRKKVTLSQLFHHDDIDFDVINGFSLDDNETGQKFTAIEEAAAVNTSFETMRRLWGQAPPEDKITNYGLPLSKLLKEKMQKANISYDQLVTLHRNSKLDDLLALFYPEIQDINERRQKAIEDFFAAQKQSLDINPQHKCGCEIATKEKKTKRVVVWGQPKTRRQLLGLN